MSKWLSGSLKTIVGVAAGALVVGGIGAPTAVAGDEVLAGPTALHTTSDVSGPVAESRDGLTVMAKKANWPLLSNPITAARALAALPLTNERSPEAAAVQSKFQLQASPTRPESVMMKSLGTAGGRVSAWLEPVPDRDERAARVPAGTAMVVSSDSTKLSEADKKALMAAQPELTSLLMPVRGGRIESGVNFRVTFQRGEKIRVVGKVKAGAKLAEARIVVERALIGDDGARGPFRSIAKVKPEADGSFQSSVAVRTGRQVIRQRLLVKSAASEEGGGRARSKVWKSFQLGVVDLVGTDVVTVNLYNDQDDALTFTMSGYPMDGCDPEQSSDCDYTTFDVTVDKGQTQTVSYIAPSDTTTLGFYAQKADGCVGKCSTYIPDWSAGVNGPSCSTMSPSPGAAMKAGATWLITIQGQITGYNGFLSSTSVNDLWMSQYSKGQQKGKYPEGCVFAIQTAFDNWWANAATWLKITIEVIAIVAISLATAGIADAVYGAWIADAGVEAAVAEAGAETTAAITTDMGFTTAQIGEIDASLDTELVRGVDIEADILPDGTRVWTFTDEGLGKISGLAADLIPAPYIVF